MKYIARHAEMTVDKLSKMFGAVLVSGPRQVGKTTMLKKMANGINYVSLDDPILRQTATETSTSFFKDHTPPIFIDEIQKCPVLFEQIKLILDKDKLKGQFLMCGSQQFRMMKGVSESLAGRIGIVTLLGLSMREIKGLDFSDPFIPTNEYLTSRKKVTNHIEYSEIWNYIFRGSMPELIDNPDYDWQAYYGAYLRTYIERDVREISEIGNSLKFMKFMTSVAASTGNLLNIANLAKDTGISQTTANRWLSILVASNLVYLLQPYYNNIKKRAVKTPKLYFLDTGLAAYLTRWNTVEVLKNGAMSGAFFETFIVSEIIKSYYNKGILEPPLYFYRDKEKNEIDLIIEQNGVLYPIEIKKHADPDPKDISAFRLLDSIPDISRGNGCVICTYDDVISISDKDKVIPVSYI